VPSTSPDARNAGLIARLRLSKDRETLLESASKALRRLNRS